jgi:hypothetical protein
MKMTLLEIVQDILSDMDSDSVNSIDDTIESTQVAQIVKTSYFAMMNSRDWPHLKRTIQFVASGDPDLPTHITLQDTIKEMVFLKYDCIKDGETRKRYKEVKWVEPDDFLRILNRRNSDNDNIQVVDDPGGIELLIQTDKDPTYYTSFNDSVIVFDSYNADVDTTIQSSKLQGYAYVIPSWSQLDTFTPEMPMEAFPLLLEEAKSKAMFKLKQVQDVKAEQESRRQNIWLSRKSYRVNGGIQYPNYGRRSGYRQHSPYIDKGE